jgi:D-tyrosyl-tRNA(Tyr) deacylase
VQRVSSAAVDAEGRRVGEIGPGLLVLLGVGAEDGPADADRLADRTARLRIFDDDEGKLNRSALDVRGEILVVSQFTLYGEVWRGLRPSFSRAAARQRGDELYRRYVATLRDQGLRVVTGEYGARMQVSLVNDGPVTILMDSERAL